MEHIKRTGQPITRGLKMSIKRLDRESNFQFMDRCVEYLGEATTLEALIRALSSDDVNEAFEYICNCHDIPYNDIVNDDDDDDADQDDEE